MFHRSLFFFSDFIARTVNRFNRLSIYFEDKYYPKVYSSNLKLIVPRGRNFGTSIARIFFLHPIIVDDRTRMKRGEKSGGNRSRFNVFRFLRSNSKMHTRDACIHAYSHYPPIYHATPAK